MIVNVVDKSEIESTNSLREATLTGIFGNKLSVNVSSLESMHRLGKRASEKS